MTNLATLALSFCLAVPPLLATNIKTASPWLQFGLGGIALFILYTVLKPLVKSQTDSNKRVVEAMEKLAEQQAVSTEIQRTILARTEAAASADSRLASTLAALEARMEEHFKADEEFQRRVSGKRAASA
jgi:hypothetical protein